MNIIIDTDAVKAIDLSDVRQFSLLDNPNSTFQWDFSNQPYRLYAYIGSLFSGKTILDIGTEWGNSALSFSQNPENNVISYDLNDTGANQIIKSNIEFKIKNFIEDQSIDWNNVAVVCIDVDPHDAIQEPIMIQHLRNIGWSGLLLLDDIGDMFPHMKEWFNTIEDQKWELDNSIGHYSGTGLVNFGGIHDIIFVSNANV